MARVERFEDLEVWQLAREFCNDIFRIMQYEKIAKDYELKKQLNASSGSVMDNIAEGFERDGRKEFAQFLSISKGSCGEARSQLYRAFDRKYVEKEEFEILYSKTITLSKSLAGFIGYLKQSEIKGLKYK